MEQNSRRQRVEWREDGRAEVGSVQELDRLLDDLTQQAKKEPFMAELISPKGDSVAIGLGRDGSVLSWVQAGGDPPYYGSKGNPKASDLVVFFYRGAWSEFPGSFVVPIAEAREAMRLFFESGQMPRNVDWEEV
jgi:hypothetical protein